MNATISPLTYADFTIELIEFWCNETGKAAACDGDRNTISWSDQ